VAAATSAAAGEGAGGGRGVGAAPVVGGGSVRMPRSFATRPAVQRPSSRKE